MSEENKQTTDGEALRQVVADASNAETFIEAKPDWVKGWRPADLVSPRPFVAVDRTVRTYNEEGSFDKTTRTYKQVTDEQLDAAVSEALESPEVDAALTNVAAEAADDAQLDAALNEMLTTPEVNAMLENVAADAAEDKNRVNSALPTHLTASGGSDYLQVLRNDFEVFKARVEKAFKHAGFKF